MLVLLPPSETKRDGGDPDQSMDLGRLAFPGLTRQRRATLAALRSLSRNVQTASSALGLGPTQRGEVLKNRLIRSSPVMPALERYTGVLFDALDVPSLSPAAREFAGATLGVHSALFGLVLGDDPIPSYRLSHDSRLPGLRLRALWRDAVTAEISQYPGFVLDLRSESYMALGPLPPDRNAVSVRTLSISSDGTTRALGHFNKRGKGLLARAIVEAGIDHPDPASLLAWASDSGLPLVPGVDRELSLIV